MPRAEGPALAELQRRFFELVTAPEGVEKELAARGLPPEELSAILDIAGDARASAAERLDVYANMYFFRILDVLRSDYPKLLGVLGDGAFHNLATDYLQAHPSRHPSLRFVGASLPGFIADHACARAEARPWLAPLAALEWARVDVFDRADQTPLLRGDLAGLAPDAFATLPLVAIAACEIVPAAWNVEDTWRTLEARARDDGDGRPEHAHDAGEPDDAVAPAPAEAGHALLVWRRGVVVSHRAASAREARALALVRAGTTFGALCTALVEQGGEAGDGEVSDEAAAGFAAQLLGQWLADELLARA